MRIPFGYLFAGGERMQNQLFEVIPLKNKEYLKFSETLST